RGRGGCREVARDVVGDLPLERRFCPCGTAVQQNGGPVGVGAHGGVRADGATGAGAVVHDDRASQFVAEGLCQFAAQDVGRATRCVRHDDANLLVGGKMLGGGGQAGGQDGGEDERSSEHVHGL